MDHIAQQFAADAESLVLITCGISRSADIAPSDEAFVEPESEPSSFVVIGAVRSVGNVQGTVLEAKVPRVAVANSGALRESFETSIKPFLQTGARSGSSLRKRERAIAFFEHLRLSVDPAAHPAVDALENWCDYRRQFDLQARIHHWLHGWLAIHLPISIALVMLMFLHAWVAMKYW